MALPRKSTRDAFIRDIWRHYEAAGRHDLPWRKTRNPYRILVSEMMLQQTQVDRVRGFYARFITRFPDLASLASAPTADVITTWQGLGYNRRALALQKIARSVNGSLPKQYDELRALPGIGPYTAGALRAFAWNKPGVLLETNVRAVYIDRFFPNHDSVSDAELVPLIEVTQDTKRPREWYWALMDYGSHLKATKGNATRRSKTYATQKKFAGSDRQVRGRILRLLASQPQRESDIAQLLGEPAERVAPLIASLYKEGFLAKNGSRYQLAH